uniref:High mobility group box n=1 Tax=Marseillevirus LCMAC202 TaxID=2506606 RepID=A0A481YYI7_9VIRU|nr:MAG: high mobility group box [Marseillevirus LCMAC202]
MNRFLLCKQDLEHYSDHDLKILAKHHDIMITNKCDLCWLLSLDIISSRQRAGMEPSELLLSLPNELIFDIGLHIPISDLLRICQINSKLNKLLCANNSYWRARYVQDFGESKVKVTNWKKAYCTRFVGTVKYRNKGYILFSNENRTDVSKSNPDLKFIELGKELGKMWGKLTDAKKREWNQKAAVPRVCM